MTYLTPNKRLENLYVKREQKKVYRIWDPVAQAYCKGGRSLYANPKSTWANKSGATNVLNNIKDSVTNHPDGIPWEVAARLIIVEYDLTPGISK